MPLETLKDLFIHSLRDLYDAEAQLLKVVPRFLKRATHEELRTAIEDHLLLTRKHVSRLERIFSQLRITPGGATCSGMQGLLKEVEQLLQQDAEETIRDAGLIAALQRVEHYEIAAYSAARCFADTLGLEDFAWILTETLEDEREADQTLSRLAGNVINQEAAGLSVR